MRANARRPLVCAVDGTVVERFCSALDLSAKLNIPARLIHTAGLEEGQVRQVMGVRIGLELGPSVPNGMRKGPFEGDPETRRGKEGEACRETEEARAGLEEDEGVVGLERRCGAMLGQATSFSGAVDADKARGEGGRADSANDPGGNYIGKE